MLPGRNEPGNFLGSILIEKCPARITAAFAGFTFTGVLFNICGRKHKAGEKFLPAMKQFLNTGEKVLHTGEMFLGAVKKFPEAAESFLTEKTGLVLCRQPADAAKKKKGCTLECPIEFLLPMGCRMEGESP